MKKLIILIVLMMIVFTGCTLLDSDLGNRVQKRRESGYGCEYDKYGNYRCGYPQY